MDIETALSDPALGLEMPPDALARVHREAARMRRRRRTALALPLVAALALIVPLATGGSDHTSLYGSRSTSPEPPTSVDPTPVPLNRTTTASCTLFAGVGTPVRTTVEGPTGDPIDTCGRYWRYALHSEPPPLIAYRTERGEVFVQPKIDQLPRGVVLLPPGVTQDTEMILMSETMGDLIAGAGNRCMARQDAIAEARRVISSTGVKDWPIRVDDSRTDPTTAQCWVAVPRHRYMWVLAVRAFGTDDVLEPLLKPLRASLTECWSRTRALSEVHKALGRVDLTRLAKRSEFEHLDNIREVDEPRRPCTVIHLSGMTFQFTLRGPA